MTTIKAKVKWVRYPPRKAMRVIDLVRGQAVEQALNLLKFMPQKGARIIEKLIKSAQANAKNNYKIKDEKLFISEAYVNKGVVLKRYHPRARGRAFPIKKRTAHLTICLSTEPAREEKHGPKD